MVARTRYVSCNARLDHQERKQADDDINSRIVDEARDYRVARRLVEDGLMEPLAFLAP